MTHLYVEHEFKPVGQGLFAFGSLEFRHVPKGKRRINLGQPPDWDFTWVYDCGSSSGQALVDRGISEIAAKVNSKLDLIAISHLHFDHISGLLRLLDRVSVKLIMLPWAPLWQRLLIGLEQGLREGDDALGFYVDPAGYLAGAAPDRFQAVVFVMPSEGGERTDPDEPVPGFDPEDLDRLRDRKGSGQSTSDTLELPDTAESRDIAQFLNSGQRVVTHGAWEFLPYNDPKSAPKSPGRFKGAVNNLRAALLGNDPDARATALEKLKLLYRQSFRAGLQNDLSLSVYAGPVPLSGWSFEWGRVRDPSPAPMTETPTPFLYTGDGNFSTKAHWLRLSRHLGNKRAEAISTFQVPHHGSRHNWKNGNASIVAPTFSVFSSDPLSQYRHPHADVLRDFWPYGPVRVDKYAGFKWQAKLYLPKE